MAKTSNTNDQTDAATTEPSVRTWERDKDGLLKGTTYERNPDGSINWRKMIKPEFLVVNKQNFERRKETPPETTEGLEDKDLLILLAGIRDLARLRGYDSIEPIPVTSAPNFASVKTLINWMPNFETEGRAVTSGGFADATPHNTNGFAKLFLSAIAENRSFVRAVRNGLGINIVGQDEVGPSTEDEADSGSQGKPSKFLDDLLSRNKIKFESFKNRMIQKEVEGAEDWESVNDVPTDKVWEVVDIVQKLLEKAKEQAKK